MVAVGVRKDEIDILYAASNKLTQASTPQEQLAATSDYARENGAASGTMFYIDNDVNGKPEWAEIVATWAIGDDRRQSESDTLGERYFLPELTISKLLKNFPDIPYLVEDITYEKHLDNTTRETFARSNARAAAILPLNSKGRWVGLLMFNWRDSHRFSERDQRIYTALMQQAAPVVDSVRLFEQTQRLLEQNRQRALRAEHLLQVNTALSRATNELEILSAVAQYAAPQGAQSLFLNYAGIDETDKSLESMVVAVWENGKAIHFDAAIHKVFRLEDIGFPKLWEMHPNQVSFVEDFSTTSYLSDAIKADLLPRVKTRALAIMPLYSGGAQHGLICVVWYAPHIFTRDERESFQELLPTVASIVATRRAYLAEQARAHELETIAKVSAAATRILDVEMLLNTAVELTQLDFSGYHLTVYLLDAGGQNLIKAASAKEDHFIPLGFAISLANAQSIIALTGGERRSIIVNDINTATTYLFETTCRDSRSEMTIPMVVGDKLIGVLDVESPDRNRFSEANARVMSMLADLLAVAVQNARLYEQAQELAALEERNRLARELHDSVSQALYGIALGARTARTLLENDPTRLGEPLDYVLTLAEAGLTEMRALIFDLRPESLENEGLITALGKQIAVLQGRHGIKVLTEFCEEPVLSLEVKEMLYRIAREALHNTVKHAQASQVSIHLKHDSSGLKLEIADNGLGFDRDGSFPGHLGLHSMRERAARLNAAITIDSAPGMGTRISVRIPMSASEPHVP